jgi:hypothetical protein
VSPIPALPTHMMSAAGPAVRARQTNVKITGNNVDIELDGTGNGVAGFLLQSAVTGPGTISALCADVGEPGVGQPAVNAVSDRVLKAQVAPVASASSTASAPREPPGAVSFSSRVLSP